MVIITNFSSKPEQIAIRRAIILTSRVHPGESNASFMMEGTLEYLVSEDEGERIEFEVEGDISDRQKAKIIEAFQESYESGPEELGWEWSDREVWFYGPIEREEE